MRKTIPNIITLFNLLSGLIALFFVFKKDWFWAALFVSIGIFFDFFDGLFARKLSVSSKLGLELDSLADMVTSGVVPAFTLFFLLQEALQIDLMNSFTMDGQHLWPFLSFTVALASALRLAKFNIDERQTTSFIGLPTPANALFIMSLPLIAHNKNYQAVSGLILNPYTLSLIIILSSWILNAELPLFSLKFKDYTWKNNKEKYVLLIISILLFIFLKFVAFPVIIILYIILSFIFKGSKREITH